MEVKDLKQLSPLGLAYIGDSIYEIMVRTRIIERGNMPVKNLHRTTVSYVCAAAQSKAFDIIEPILTEEELSFYKRGRNANGNHVPKSSNPVEYRRATGVEALFGYLYLNENLERINELFDMIYENINIEEAQ